MKKSIFTKHKNTDTTVPEKVPWSDVEAQAWADVVPLHVPDLPTPIVPVIGTILAPESTTQEDVVVYTIDRGQKSGYSEHTIIGIIGSYWQWASEAGIDPALLVAHMLHATNFLSSWWAAKPRRNPAGLGVDGAVTTRQPTNAAEWQYNAGRNEWKHGYAFGSWEEAARAHAGHMLCYACTDENMSPVQLDISNADPLKHTFTNNDRGCAKHITDLNGKWTSGKAYGEQVLAILEEMKR